ncbi:urea carboxylase [Sphaerotilus mobilis]|uniref:Urea carboxylase n=1 Tax=Sphaerotilus mobilis TaxID=47994 RepID=A0A4Q7LMH1_9BURK|nr:urea carboxylase [Sphaerotilus mobilis]RZS54908.1 urea carboxylase [Sphaerotilus mobilis]
MSFDTVLIANRGAIAVRIIRTLRDLGLRAVAVHSEADADAAHVRLADAAVCIGPAPAAQSYLDGARILAAARETGAGAIHPGYGFLSENPAFAQACEDAGIAFIGPSPAQMRAFGLKHTARSLASELGVPLLPGTGLLSDVDAARVAAERIGYPVMLKSTAGGGGIGMRRVDDAAALGEAWASVQRLAQANFKDAGLYVEKFITRARHIEVQVFGDGRGQVIALGERDCSAQRRHQKVVEETPAPHLDAATRADLCACAVRLAQAVSYRSAGTVEFVLDADSGAFHFLEVNTRLQVEHGVTEQVTGVDLVAWMVKLARGDAFELVAPEPRGAAIQVRLYAEDPARQFQPSAGLLTEVVWPDPASGVRVDGWVARGTDVPPHYDPMLAKLIVTGRDRTDALARLRAALAETRLGGIATNLGYLRALVAAPVFEQGRVVTATLADFRPMPRALEVLDGGVMTSVQDWPGRQGYWHVGVPPSGPMDELGHRLANRLVGNPADAATLECTLAGPTLRCLQPLVVALAGAAMPMTLEVDGRRIALATGRAHELPAGAVLRLGALEAGARACLAVRGGVDVPAYLGSRATFTLGQFGGHGGRHLRVGDLLPVGDDAACPDAPRFEPPALALPAPGRHWRIGVLDGPHGAPDFFTPEDIATFYATDWQVHHNSSRTGVRLIGPKPTWARPDGGEAGLHPSNLHDNAYAIGAVDYTGDMPVILGPDGPSLGGFVCPAVVVAGERWKLGQLRPGDTLRFVPLSLAQALSLHAQLDAALATLEGPLPELPAATLAPTGQAAILSRREGEPGRPARVIRQSGDRYLLLEYGEPVLDIALRLRVHALMRSLEARIEAGDLRGVIDLTPGIRSLQVHHDPRVLDREALLALLAERDDALGPTDDLSVPSRTVWLPLSWDDPSTRLAIEKYMQSVRPDAPWCPSNIEFIRRINGLDHIDDVYRTVFDARYLVLGLGDVYLGAPVATPLDPRHRLVTTKYNPARTWTPENAVGIGGAYLCVYGMEGPGGYQFVGRTLQMWNRWRDARDGATDFEPGQPWLLRFFDQIRFYPVDGEELARIRRDFPAGRHKLRTEPGRFSLRDYQAFLDDQADAIAAFRTTQRAAFSAERERWAAAGQAEHVAEADGAASTEPDEALPPGARAVASPVPGSVWKLLVEPGATVREGQPLLVVESMKMEFTIAAPSDGRLRRLLCREGGAVAAGQTVAVIDNGDVGDTGNSSNSGDTNDEESTR